MSNEYPILHRCFIDLRIFENVERLLIKYRDKNFMCPPFFFFFLLQILHFDHLWLQRQSSEATMNEIDRFKAKIRMFTCSVATENRQTTDLEKI